MVVKSASANFTSGRIQVAVAKLQHNSKPVRSYVSEKEVREVLLALGVASETAGRILILCGRLISNRLILRDLLALLLCDLMGDLCDRCSCKRWVVSTSTFLPFPASVAHHSRYNDRVK